MIWDPELEVYDLGASAELWDGGGDRLTMLEWMPLQGEVDDAHEESSQWWIDALEESLQCRAY